MQYPLSISGPGEAPATCVLAEADLGPHAESGAPEFFFGRLVEVSDETLRSLRDASGIEVRFRGAAYRFETLAPSASFKLVRRPSDGG